MIYDLYAHKVKNLFCYASGNACYISHCAYSVQNQRLKSGVADSHGSDISCIPTMKCDSSSDSQQIPGMKFTENFLLHFVFFRIKSSIEFSNVSSMLCY